jgi:hypothetical protein
MTIANLARDYVTPPAIYQEQLPSIWKHQGSETLGPDSEKRNDEANRVIEHWSSRPTLILLAAQTNDLTYNNVPLAPGRTVKTRYRYIGRLPVGEFPEAD